MTKAVIFLLVLVVLLVSVTPASAKQVFNVSPILDIDYENRRIELYYGFFGYKSILWFEVAEHAAILIPDNTGNGEFEDLEIGQLIIYVEDLGVITNIKVK